MEPFLKGANNHPKIETNTLYLGDCLSIMTQIPDESIDMILCDLPYGTTNNKWDIIIPFEPLWQQYERIIKPNGAMVFTASQPFTSLLVMSNPKLFKYEWIWEKTIGSGQLNINIMPLKVHESILVFYKNKPIYNQQFSEGTPYTITRKIKQIATYNKQKNHTRVNEGLRYPKSIIKVSNPRIKGGHPTQKPVALFEYLIRIYTNEKNIVLDNCIGAGTTAIACINTNRQYIGIEINKDYFRKAIKNVQETIS